MNRVAALLAAALLAGCAARTTAAEKPAEKPRVPGPAAGSPVPGVADLVQDRTVFFTRRVADETVAFRFTATELTSRGRLLGELAWEGRRGGGRASGVAATLGFDRGQAGDCQGRVTLRFEPVPLEGLAAPATLDPVSVELRRAGAVGRAAATLCEGAGELVATLRDLGARLADLVPRDRPAPTD
jgi:hypothetical protein